MHQALAIATGWSVTLAGLVGAELPAPRSSPDELELWRQHRLPALERTLRDRAARYGSAARAETHLERLAALRRDLDVATAPEVAEDLASRLQEFRRAVMLDHPRLRNTPLLVVRRRPHNPVAVRRRVGANPRLSISRDPGREIALPSNHECNSSIERDGHDNAIGRLDRDADGFRWTTIFEPSDGGYVGEFDLDWDAQRLVFTRSFPHAWRLCTMTPDGREVRVIGEFPDDVDVFDAAWLPDGGLVFGATATFQSVPCWHGQKKVANLYRLEPDGRSWRQLCFDQDHNLHPAVLSNGQIVYSRWEYAGISHIYLRLLMVMNPDGTGQRAIYGSNSWYPNALYFPRELPGRPGRLVAILSGYHGPHRCGRLVVVDTRLGAGEGAGIFEITGDGRPRERRIADQLVQNEWPLFLTPYPIDDTTLLVSMKASPTSSWCLAVADTFDNLAPVFELPGYALIEPMPLAPRPRPPALPDRTDPSRDDALVYIHDVYQGPGLEGVPRGTVRRLRVIAYHYGYLNLAGPDYIGLNGPWEPLRIIGTVPIEEDGSALFRVPARTPIAFQTLDEHGAAVQLMRSWTTAMPGEYVSCVGCHETTPQAAPARPTAALARPPRDLEPWRGPPRGFAFHREVQPVLDHHCRPCHDGTVPGRPDLRPAEAVPGYVGVTPSKLTLQRMHPAVRAALGDRVRFSPAYEALVSRIRRVGIEDVVDRLVPGEYHVDTSPLVQMLRRGHHGVHLDAEAWDRLVTWIDLNAPYHGTWGEVVPVPEGMPARRLALWRITGGPRDDPEAVPETPRYRPPPDFTPPSPPPTRPPAPPLPPPRPRQCETDRVTARQRTISLGEGLSLQLVWVPGGTVQMGDADGADDERPATQVEVEGFWMSVCEISNEQFARLVSGHLSGRYGKRHREPDDPGLPLDGPTQPVVRVSWHQAREFCRRLSALLGEPFDLPTEAQWEYAARLAGWPRVPDLQSRRLNAADATFLGLANTALLARVTGGIEHLLLDGETGVPAVGDDGHIVTAPVGTLGADSLGLCDLIGNVAEWTRSRYAPYPYAEHDGRNDDLPDGERVVRGGSFFDPPPLCRPTIRTAYPPWRRLFNVGFRVVSAGRPPSVAAR
ncbi:MAG: SUMF1/EgtB/PvdO family nonheme iron enzyme [Kiritimatiellae bacterium]|nr:SUMF1/EgtB/PvdO family nonheme iron enzyme [Kiritimatiellia bacterium]